MNKTLLLLAVVGLLGVPASAATTITERFIAPCCWRENLSVHQSPEAEKMRSEIVQLVEAGKTEEQIVEYYVNQYGERILRMPRGSRYVILTLTPLIALMLGSILLLRYVKLHRRLTPSVSSGAALPVLSESELEW